MTEVSKISYRGSEDTRLAARSKAVAEAVENAKADARSAAAVVGMKLGKVEHVKIRDDLSVDPSTSTAKESNDFAFENRMDGYRNVFGGGQTVMARVTVSFFLLKS